MRNDATYTGALKSSNLKEKKTYNCIYIVAGHDLINLKIEINLNEIDKKYSLKSDSIYWYMHSDSNKTSIKHRKNNDVTEHSLFPNTFERTSSNYILIDKEFKSSDKRTFILHSSFSFIPIRAMYTVFIYLRTHHDAVLGHFLAGFRQSDHVVIDGKLGWIDPSVPHPFLCQ